MTQVNNDAKIKQKEPEKVQKWSEIEELFDKLDDMQKRVWFLRDLIIQTNICSDTTCEIYPALHELKSHVKNLREYGFFRISDSAQITNEQNRKRFIELMRDLEKESESVFSKIFALCSVKKTKEIDGQKWHERQIAIMKVQNESRFPISQEFQDSSQRYIDEVQKNATLQDSELFKDAKKKILTGGDKAGEKKT